MKNLMPAAMLVLFATVGNASGFCFDKAGETYQINPDILRAISKHESNDNPNLIHWNKNGSYDVGLMGINSCHADELGPERWSALREPCNNVMTGAWLLRRCINKYGYNWRAVGCFNSEHTSVGDKYIRSVYTVLLKQIYAERRLSTTTGAVDVVAGSAKGALWREKQTSNISEENAE